jgi:hypothetical protein
MQFLVAGYIDGTVIIWELQTNKVVTVQEQLHNSVVVSAKVYDFIDATDSLISLVSVEAEGNVLNSKIERHKFHKREPEISVN